MPPIITAVNKTTIDAQCADCKSFFRAEIVRGDARQGEDRAKLYTSKTGEDFFVEQFSKHQLLNFRHLLDATISAMK